MALKVQINYCAEISVLTERYPGMNFLNDITIPKTDMNCWVMNNEDWQYYNRTVYGLQVMFIGKTGYGKSTTLNQIVGQEVFQTSTVSSCTKNLYEATYRINASRGTFLSLCDLPGIGESSNADKHYYEWYRDMLKKSHCVVYIMRADQRDFSCDEQLFFQMFKNENQRKKVLIALNFADKIEPVNRHLTILSAEQITHLEKKVCQISKIFKTPTNNILYYSATDKLNLKLLMIKIAEKLKEMT